MIASHTMSLIFFGAELPTPSAEGVTGAAAFLFRSMLASMSLQPLRAISKDSYGEV
jgi:hypothetical protein